MILSLETAQTRKTNLKSCDKHFWAWPRKVNLKIASFTDSNGKGGLRSSLTIRACTNSDKAYITKILKLTTGDGHSHGF